jgi:hypothetical protein
MAVTEWDLIEVNMLVENINESLFRLTKSIAIAKKGNISSFSPELSLWVKSISKRKKQITLIKNHLINSALRQSALQLKLSNQSLSTTAEDLLALVRENIAAEGLQPFFLKAQREYEPYLIINENLSLADSTKTRNKHSYWYKSWHQLESDTLTMPKPIENYLLKAKRRAKELDDYIEKEKASLAALSQQSHLSDTKLLTSSNINHLITKLKRDKTLVSYGAARN